MQNKIIDTATFQQELMQFTGTAHWYQHPLMLGLTYTEGVNHFAKRSESYWLLDIIATEYFPMLMEHPFLSITVLSQKNRGQIVVTDGNENKLKSKHIEFTNLIEGTWRFYLTNDVLLLPSEY